MSDRTGKITRLSSSAPTEAQHKGAEGNAMAGETRVDSEGFGSASAAAPKRPAKGIYVLPNLFTTAGLFAGFYAIMQARLGHFEAACLGVYAAMIMDIIDGRLARLTNTMSEFGSEYDSLADMVSFGVAPALLMYEFVLQGLGRVGSLVAFIYIACAALRLARFNVTRIDDKKYFIGVPSPGAAAMIASVIWASIDYQVEAEPLAGIFLIMTALIAFAMVSNIRYRSFKDVEFRDKMPFIGLILLVVVIAIIYLDPPLAFLSIGTIYLTSGAITYLLVVYRRYRRRRHRESNT